MSRYNFTHLHVHTEYSLLDGSNKIKACIARAKELGMDSIAITDHGVMYGVIDFYKAALAEGIKPILGCEVYVATKSRFDRESSAGEDRYNHLVLLAENNKGYENLVKLVSIGFKEGYYYRPQVDKEVLEKYSEGLIALSACLAGEIPRHLMRGFYEEAKASAVYYESVFGKGNFFLELQDHGMPEQQMVNPQIIRLSNETGIPLVVTNDVHYTYADDAASHDILLCIQTGKKLSDEDRMRYEGGQYYIKSEEEMLALFPSVTEALENTGKIAARCNVEIKFHERKLPVFDTPAPFTSEEYLRKLCEEGLLRRYGAESVKHKERLDYELGVISGMGFVDYFLIVWDFIKYAKDNGIAVGPGRGSAAGSIVAFCLGITDIDPIKYQLLFERFLNPERVSMPDIDVDFCYERRQEVIAYVIKKYGADKVAQIVTFGTLQAKGVIRDVGRVMDLPYAKADSIAKMIPNELGITIAKALKLNPDLNSLYEDDEEIKMLLDMGMKLEGLPRHTSMHAAGVVICQAPVDEYVPLSRGSDGVMTTQFTMTTLEELGLLKMDFLGLRTLTVIQDAVNLVYKTTGKRLDMANIDYDDKDVLDFIGSGKTDGVFQLESAGMKSFMKELLPQSLEDIIAGISLYRPGPMDFIPKYIKGKNNPETISYSCPQLEPILEPTYGCIVYQEQVMQIVRDLGGFSLGRSDLLRRAMSKKKADVMAKEQVNFVEGNEKDGIPGCVANGISKDIANGIFDDMTDFAKYAFNKSHAAAYAVVSYQTAYLKYYYPVEFMAALMTSVMHQPTKVASYIYECKQMGIEVLSPDVNEGEGNFSVHDGHIRYGMLAIKNLGRPVIEVLENARRENGKFTSFNDFIERMINGGVNKRALENLIKAGALDSLWPNRRQMVFIYEKLADQVQADKKKSISGQMTLFDIAGEEDKSSFRIEMPNVEEFDKQTLLGFEKEVLGIYISGHPLEDYADTISRASSAKTTDFEWDDEAQNIIAKDGSKQVVGGMITGITVKMTRNEKRMAFLTLEDLFGAIEVIVFPKDYERFKALFVEDEKVLVRGKVQLEEEKGGKLILENIVSLSRTRKELWIRFEDFEEYRIKEKQLMAITSDYYGDSPVKIFLNKTKQFKTLPVKNNVSVDELLLERLKSAFGRENIIVKEKAFSGFDPS